MSSDEKNLSLPPFCVGKLRGNLELVIQNINWMTSKSFSNVKVNILWWGQKKGYCSEIEKISKKYLSESVKTIKYQIKTNQRLFQCYLKNCEPLSIEFYSSKTNDYIGSSKIEVSTKFHSDICYKISSDIVSKRKFILGEITVIMKMQEIRTPKSSLKLLETKKINEEKQLPMCKNPTYSNKENVQLDITTKKVSSRNFSSQKDSMLQNLQILNKSYTSIPNGDFEGCLKRKSQFLSTCDQLKLIKVNGNTNEKTLSEYLSGEPMSTIKKLEVIENLASTSPSLKLVNSLSNDSNPKRGPSNRTCSIRVRVLKAECNFCHKKEHNSKYVLKCAITSKIFQANSKIKILSSVFEAQQSCNIPFLQEVCQIIECPSSCDESVCLNFGLSLKSIGQHPPHSFFLGFTRVDLKELFGTKKMLHKNCPIISEQNMIVGKLLVKLELESNVCTLYDHVSIEKIKSFSQFNIGCINLVKQKFRTTSHPSSSNKACEKDQKCERETLKTRKKTSEDQRETKKKEIEEEKESTTDNQKSDTNIEYKLYQGLFYIEKLCNIKDDSSAEYFITYEGFWNEIQESTLTSVGLIFNYLKLFPVILDDSFLKKVQNNHLQLKLWERTYINTEKLVGSAKIPLHQFFIAFRDVLMIEHLSLNHLPIISIDACTNFFSPLSNELFCQGKVLMAIGSDAQIEYLKITKNLNNLSIPIQSNPEHVSPYDSSANINMKNKLTEFIESLSQKLPESENTYHKLTSPLQSSSQPQLRKTSDLLETLQQALSKPSKPPLGALEQERNSESSMSLILQEKRIRVLIILEHALHLHKVVKKRQNRRKNKINLTTTEFEPSSYATFDSSLESQSFELKKALPENIVKSHEGFVYCSKVIKSVDPNWNESFDVELPLDLLTNSEKRFIVKIWRKCSQEADMKPAPFEDAVIGFTAVDLSVLLTGLPILSGYYNIMDFAGRCNGQIKLTFKPFNNLVGYQNSLPTSFLNPLNVDVSLSDDGSNLLSRTLKRKFTELDEITQRLKARLYDVTGDENFDPDEEFERDLNTTVDEDMDDENPSDFEWLKNDSNGNNFKDSSSYQSELNNFLQLQPSTSKSGMESFSTIPTQRLVSGCSNSPSPMDIGQLLNKYDLDTLINPSIFKNILDPSLANSDSTPTLNPINSNIKNDSSDTTESSIISNDNVQSIQKALQQTSITDIERKDGDGH